MVLSLTAADRKLLLRAIICKIAVMEDPVRMRELAHLGLDMLLRRAEDKELRDSLNRRVEEIFAEPTGDGGAIPAPESMQRASAACIDLLEVAEKQRQPRAVVKLPTLRPTPKPGRVWPALAAMTLLLLPVAGLVALAEPSLLPAEEAVPPTAAELAAAIAETVSGAGPRVIGATRLYLARGLDDRALVVAEAVPRRLCAATGAMLIRQGTLIVNGRKPEYPSTRAVAARCAQGEGEAVLIWSPNDRT